MKKSIAAWVAVLAAGGLSACAVFSGKPSPDLACPQTGFLLEAAHQDVLTSESSTAKDDVIVSADLADFKGGCSFKKGMLDFNLDLKIAAERGPKGPALDHYNFPYFIAVLSPDRQILQRTSFSTNVAFDNTGKGLSAEEHSLQIPVAQEKDARNYQVLVGFELSPAQLDHNRKNIKE